MAALRESPARKDSQTKPTFKCLSKLGKGAYATVWLAVDQETSTKVAVKVVSEPRYFAAAVQEASMAQEFDHPNLVKTTACFKTQAQSVMMVQEFAERGDLFNVIMPEVGVEHDLARSLFAQVVDGVQYLHSRDFVHRDIKPENVVMFESGLAKLCDFGMMERHGRLATHGSGTTPYMAPEILASRGGLVARKEHDIWSLGVLLYVLLTGDFPWLRADASDREFSAFSRGERPGRWASFSDELVAFLRCMLCPESQRCNIDFVLAHQNVPYARPAEDMSLHEEEDPESLLPGSDCSHSADGSVDEHAAQWSYDTASLASELGSCMDLNPPPAKQRATAAAHH